MDIAMVGLGRMGGNMARRLLKGGHRVVGYNRSPEVTHEIAAEAGLTPALSLHEVVTLLTPPRAVWVMVPAGDATEKAIEELAGLLSEGDIIIDGGNTFYKDDIRRAGMLAARGIDYVDSGTSGGIWGLAEGYSLMIGGAVDAVEHLRPVFETLAPAPDKGWGHVGPRGAGHFVKMVHNGIEYGMMQAFAEGFEIMKARRVAWTCEDRPRLAVRQRGALLAARPGRRRSGQGPGLSGIAGWWPTAARAAGRSSNR
jgi:6-phosphogluconate dehydrogenase